MISTDGIQYGEEGSPRYEFFTALDKELAQIEIQREEERTKPTPLREYVEAHGALNP